MQEKLNRKARRAAAAQTRDKRVTKGTAKYMARASKQNIIGRGQAKLAFFWAAVI